MLQRYKTKFSFWSTVKPDKKLENHHENLESLLKQCQEKNLKLNKKKVKFQMTDVKFKGQILTADGLKMTAIRDIQTPKNVTEIVAAKPLQDLTCEKNRWQRAKVI